MALAIAVSIPTSAALAAHSRVFRSIASGSVMLSDLFAGLEPGQDCEIGPGPVPGGRIVVEQPQLAAIAEQFGVEWQPGAGSAQVVLERKARHVAREEVLPVIRRALIEAGAGPDTDLAFNGPADIAISAEFRGAPGIEDMAYDRVSGRFAADLVFNTTGLDPLHLRISGYAQEMVFVPVTTHAMKAGTILQPSDLQGERVRRSVVGDRTLMTAQGGIGLALKQRVAAGVPIASTMLGRPNLILRGMQVLLRLEGPGLVLTTKGDAIEAGALGDRIHVLNPTSRIILTARVIGPGAVQVDAASGPVALATGQSDPSFVARGDLAFQAPGYSGPGQ